MVVRGGVVGSSGGGEGRGGREAVMVVRGGVVGSSDGSEGRGGREQWWW